VKIPKNTNPLTDRLTITKSRAAFCYDGNKGRTAKYKREIENYFSVQEKAISVEFDELLEESRLIFNSFREDIEREKSLIEATKQYRKEAAEKEIKTFPE